eukprot:12998588-Ditylum_brightwellii.AAC.1
MPTYLMFFSPSGAVMVKMGASSYRLLSGARGDDNSGGKSGSKPFKISHDSSHLIVIPKKCPSRPFKEYTKKN